MFKKLIFLILVFIAGGLGGLFLPGIVMRQWPDLPLWSRTQTVIVNKTEEVIVGERETLNRAYRKILPALAAVKAYRGDVARSSGAGFVVGSDGLVLTRTEWVSAGASRFAVEWDAREIPAQVVKTSDALGLALLRMEASNLPVVSFAENASGLLGNTVFLMGTKRSGAERVPFVNSGVIKSADGNLLDTTIREEFKLATGTPLAALDGNIVGINSVNSAGYVFAVSADAIKEFLK